MIQRGYRCGSPLLFPMKFRGNRGVIRALLRVIEHPPTDRLSLRTHCVHLPESSTHLALASNVPGGAGGFDNAAPNEEFHFTEHPIVLFSSLSSFAHEFIEVNETLPGATFAN